MSDPVSGNGQREALPPRGVGRRRSLITLGVLLLGLPAAFVIREALDEGWRQITSVELVETRGVIYLPQIQVFLVHTEDGPIALSALSSHQGDRVVYCRLNDSFVEAHGAQFDRQGRYITGPATRGLDTVALRVRDGLVEINPTRVMEGPSREVFGTPLQGEFCEVPGPEDPPGFAAEPYDPSDDPF